LYPRLTNEPSPSLTNLTVRFFVLLALFFLASQAPFAAAPDAESIATFEPDCYTPKSVFTLGESVCAIASGAQLGPPAQRRFEWVAPDGTVLRLAPDIISDPQGDSLVIPNSGPFAQVGTWTVKTVDSSNNGFAVARFVVHNPNSASADLSVSMFGPFQISAGSTATFSLLVNNSGPNEAHDVRILVAAATNSLLISAEQTAGPPFGTSSSPGGPAIFSIEELPPNVTASFVFVYQVNSDLQRGASLSSTATVSSSTPELYAGDNAATATTSITPRPCTIACPSNVAVTKPLGQCGSIVNYPVAGSTGDDCGQLTCSPGSGSVFPVGTSNVICFGNTGVPCGFTVTVNETQPPTIECPSDVFVNESSPGMGLALVRYKSPVLNDSCAADVSACNPPSGSSFPLGSTKVACEVRNAAGERASCSFTVTVEGVECSLVCPADIVRSNDPGVCGSVVNYAARKVAPGCKQPICTPPPGSLFPIGATVVSCNRGLASECVFTVTVRDTQPPAITNVSAVPSILPFDNGLKDVAIKYDISGGCSGDTTCSLTVSSNETATARRGKDVDWIVTDAHRVRLRPGRSNGKNSRIYTITIACANSSGNTSTKSVTVVGSPNRP
jgi:hypothetical protein